MSPARRTTRRGGDLRERGAGVDREVDERIGVAGEVTVTATDDPAVQRIAYHVTRARRVAAPACARAGSCIYSREHV
ncbi:MAG: hypothetical protein K8W52_26905 [Deltaproteobacteria bacterium]|nr:hypothetical protein [Deltaproteobacteria bacterium]